MNGLLAKLMSAAESSKRRLRGLLSDPVGELEKTADDNLLAYSIEPLKRMAGVANQHDPLTWGQPNVEIGDYMGAGVMPMGLLGKISVARNSKALSLEEQLRKTHISEEVRAQRMADMGMERGWYRGGPAPKEGRRTGPWYTRNKSEAENYARRFGDDADVREYALPKNRIFDTTVSYPTQFANDLSNMLRQPYYGEEGKKIAGDLDKYYVSTGERVPGIEAWMSLKTYFGNDGAAEILDRLGKFNGVKNITNGPEVMIFKNAPIRDANLAAFIPENRAIDNIYGHATPELMGLLAGAGLLGGAEVYRRQHSE